MLLPLHPSRGLAISLALCLVLLSPVSLGFAAESPEEAETVTLVPSERLLADHGGEAAGSGLGVLGGATVAPVLSTLNGKGHPDLVSESLWGNMLLTMAYQRDPEIQRIAKKLGRVDALTMLAVAGVSGLGLAQGIVAYRQIQPETIDVTGGHGAGGHDHVHIPAESTTPAVMGIVGSSVTLGTLGFRAVMAKRYSHLLYKRQAFIRERISQALASLEAGEPTASAESSLTSWVGDHAAREFLQLWKVTHP